MMNSHQSSDLSGGLVSKDCGGGLVTPVKKSLNLGEVSRVSDEVRKFLAHVGLSHLKETVTLLPELLFGRHGSKLTDLNVAEIHLIEDTHRSEESLVALEVSQLSSLGEHEQAERWMVGHAHELSELVCILFIDNAGFDLLDEAQLEDVLAVVLPHALEVRLIGKLGCHLVRHDHVFLFDDLGGKLAKSLVLKLESCGTLRRAGIHAEKNVLILVSVGERVKDAVTLLVTLTVKQVTSVASPAHLGHLVVEEAILEATLPVLETEPLEGVGLIALTTELLGCPLGLEVVHGVLPGLARIGIDIPTVLVLVLGPIGDLETLEDGPGASVEGDVTDALKKSVWVEVLGVHVMHHVRLLVELVAIHILDANSYIIIKIKISTLLVKNTT